MDSFSWRSMGVERPSLPAGRYASDVVDQHRNGWCGWCYLVAAAQMVEDRALIAMSKSEGRLPHGHVSLTAFENTLFHEQYEDDDGWTTCHGGSSLHVLECMQDGRCPLRWTLDGDTTFLFEEVSVFKSRRVPPWEVRSELHSRGPLVLEVNAATLKSARKGDGKVQDLTYREPNHAVCVVGWEGDSWIVRNSWGTGGTVPVEVPSNYKECSSTRHETNTCGVHLQTWNSRPDDPGFVYLPMSFAPLHVSFPSPWIAADVKVERKGRASV